MGRTASARRHAQAVFEIALEQKELERWRSDLEASGEVLKNEQLLTLLQNPKIRLSEKTHLLEELLPGISPWSRNLLNLLVAKNRLGIFSDIVAEYNRLLDAHYGVEHAEVVTAMPLEQTEQQRLQERFSALTGKKVLLTSNVDPNIIGGMIARIGDKLIDGSVHTTLQKLKVSLRQGG